MLLVDKNKIYIKDYQEVLMMDSHFFKIKMNHYFLNIKGDSLEMFYYDSDEIRLKGTIKIVEYV